MIDFVTCGIIWAALLLVVGVPTTVAVALWSWTSPHAFGWRR